MSIINNYNWVNQELHYKYNEWLLKTLNPYEKDYLKILRDGVDEQITSSISWVNNNLDELMGLNSFTDWMDYYYDTGDLERILNQVKDYNIKKSLEPIYTFHKNGSLLAYKHMDKEYYENEALLYSLKLLENFIQTVVDSINMELMIGITYLLGQSIQEKTLNDYANKIITAQYTAGMNKFYLNKKLLKDNKDKFTRVSMDTRCLYTAKTEYARAVNTGVLQAYVNYGVEEFDWITSGLNNTCRECLSIETGSPYSLDEIMRLLPVHPNCACSIKGRLRNNLSLNSNPVVVDLTPK